jgi:hypothetical protein
LIDPDAQKRNVIPSWMTEVWRRLHMDEDPPWQSNDKMEERIEEGCKDDEELESSKLEELGEKWGPWSRLS